MKIKNQPATIDGAMSGTMMSLQQRSQSAPEFKAASSSELCTYVKAAEIVRTDMVMYLTRYATTRIHIVEYRFRP